MSPRKAKSAPLPGMEDHAIPQLEDVAASYADVRDRRMALNKEEAELKKTALALMHKFDKQIYKHDGIEIRVVQGEEDVKVKIHKETDDDDDEDDDDVQITASSADKSVKH